MHDGSTPRPTPFWWRTTRAGLGIGLGALDEPAFGQALWALYDATGIRPEYVLPVLYAESGLSTTATNSIGCVGLNQACPNAMTVPAGYVSWSASQQVNGLIAPMFRAIVQKFGGLHSGTRVYLANFLPALLPRATTLDSVLAVRGSAVYNANAGLDKGNTGAIRVSDLAAAVAHAASTTAVQQAIAAVYTLRPGETPRDPVYGTDFSGITWKTVAGGVLILGAVVGGAYLVLRAHGVTLLGPRRTR